jgi:hypothetical protein
MNGDERTSRDHASLIQAERFYVDQRRTWQFEEDNPWVGRLQLFYVERRVAHESLVEIAAENPGIGEAELTVAAWRRTAESKAAARVNPASCGRRASSSLRTPRAAPAPTYRSELPRVRARARERKSLAFASGAPATRPTTTTIARGW